MSIVFAGTCLSSMSNWVLRKHFKLMNTKNIENNLEMKFLPPTLCSIAVHKLLQDL